MQFLMVKRSISPQIHAKLAVQVGPYAMPVQVVLAVGFLNVAKMGSSYDQALR